jgi:hypothetical protein
MGASRDTRHTSIPQSSSAQTFVSTSLASLVTEATASVILRFISGMSVSNDGMLHVTPLQLRTSKEFVIGYRTVQNDFACVEAICITHAPLVDRKRFKFPADIRKNKLGQITYMSVNVASL